MPALRLAASLLALLAQPAAAHGLSDVDSGSLWSYDPWLMAPLYVVGIGFYIGTQRLWAHAGGGRGVSFRQVGSFWTGWLVAALAVTSPLHWLGERLFTAHMAEHELLMVVAAPLMAYAKQVLHVEEHPAAAHPRTSSTFMRSGESRPSGATRRVTSLDDALALVRERVAGGERLKDVCADVAAGTGVSKKALYDGYVTARP